MPIRLIIGVVLAYVAFAFIGCDGGGVDEFEEEIVVSSVLIAGEPLPSVRLSRTAPIGDPFDIEAQVVADGEVVIELLGQGGGVERTFQYAQQDIAGVYLAQEGDMVMGGRTYRLRAVVPGFELPATALTTVPTEFEVVRPPPDTVVYQEGEPPSVGVTPSLFGDRQATYLFTVRSLAPDSTQLTPFAADLFANRDVELNDFVEGNSPILNEGNYERNPDGSLDIRIPWLAISFYGPTQFTATALDDALVDFIQSQAVQFVPTTLSPGEIPNVVSNVENGVGVFGSAAQVTSGTFVARPGASG